MEGRLHTQELIPSLSCRVWSRDIACLSHTTLPALRKCECNNLSLTPSLTCGYILHSYEMMMQCWKMSAEDRPTFKEICSSVSKFIERIAGYLEIGFNPFTAAECGVGEGEVIEEEKSEA